LQARVLHEYCVRACVRACVCACVRAVLVDLGVASESVELLAGAKPRR